MSDGFTQDNQDYSTTSEISQPTSNAADTTSQPKVQSSLLMKPNNPSNSGQSGLLRGQGASGLSKLHNQPMEAQKARSDEVVMTKYKAYWVNKKEEDKIYSVVVELPHLETVGEAIRDVLPLINAELEAEESAYVLSEDPKQFDLFQAKKTGHAKTDYPALDAGQLLGQTKVDKISLVEKDARAVTLRVHDKKAMQNNHNQSVASSTRESMIETSMPLELSRNTNQHLDLDYTTETYCCCLKRKVPVQRSKDLNVSLQPTNLNSSLLQTQQ
jgi:hypothetical protein